MTHLSDLSYLQRGVSTAWFYGWFVIYVFRWDRFEALRLRRMFRFELRSVVTLLVLISLGLQLAYDIGSARLKYLEGFWVNPRTQEIQSKPAQAWSGQDIQHVEPLYYTLACALALENSVFFLLQAFWSYISKSVTKSSFMSSFEFKVNIAASCFVVVLFPTVQYLFRNDFVYREVIPQIIFSTLTLITGILGIRTHFRLVSLIKNARVITSDSTISVLQKLEYFKDMNLVLTFGFFGCAVPLGITSADGLLTKPVISGNKFASDLLITNLNFFEFIIWVTLTLIFYPRKTDTGSPFGSSNLASHNPATRNSRDAHLPRFNEVKPQDDDYFRKPLNPKDYDLDNDPVWNNEVVGNGGRYQPRNPYQKHNRTFSNESRQTTVAAVLPPLPAAAMTRSSSATPSKKSGKGNRNSGGNNDDRNENISNTIYYQDGLAKQKQQQQLARGSGFSSVPPRRTFSQSSEYDADNHYRSRDKSPQRSSSQRPLVPKSGKTSARHTPNNSVDFKPTREYPSLVQEAANWSSDPHRATSPITSGTPHHPFGTQSQFQPQPHYDQDATILSRRRSSAESDHSLIQIAYVQPMEEHAAQEHAAQASHNVNSFYLDIEQDDDGDLAINTSPTPPSGSAPPRPPRPYSSRHF